MANRNRPPHQLNLAGLIPSQPPHPPPKAHPSRPTTTTTTPTQSVHHPLSPPSETIHPSTHLHLEHRQPSSPAQPDHPNTPSVLSHRLHTHQPSLGPSTSAFPFPCPSAISTSTPFPAKPPLIHSLSYLPLQSYPPSKANAHPSPASRPTIPSNPTHSNTFLITPISPSSSYQPTSYFSNYPPSSSSPTTATSTPPTSNSPTALSRETPSTTSLVPFPFSHPDQPLTLPSTRNCHRQSSVSSTSTDLRASTRSTSSLSSSSPSSTDHHIPIPSPTSINPWPVPPSSTNPLSPLHFGWPRKSPTYSPLRTWSYAPPLHPSLLVPLQRLSSPLAYLDLSSPPMSHRTGNLSSILSQSSGINCGPSSHPGIRPASITSHKSSASRDTFYEDAPDKAEWMEIDSGDAYDDLEKTEKTVRKISQRLSLLNSVQAINLAAEARTRYHAMSESGKSQDMSSLLHLSSSSRTSHSLSNYSHQPTSFQSTDQNPTCSSDRDSYASSKTSSSSRSHHSLMSSELDRNPSRSNTAMDRLSLGSVPLFTRAISSLREDREEEKEKELQPIPEAPDLERAEEFFRITGSPTSMAGSSRRRLKPLILRTSPPNLNSSRMRASSADPASRNSHSSGSASPYQTLYETQSLLVSNRDTWNSSEKSSHDVTLKHTEVIPLVTELQQHSPPPSIDGQNASVVVEFDHYSQPKQPFLEAVDENHLITFPNVKPPTKPADNDQAPMIKSSKERPGTFGTHPTKPVWAVHSHQSDNVISRESLVTLAIGDITSFTPEPQKSFAITEDDKATSDNSVAPKASLKNLSPLKTQFLTPARQRASSHHSALTGISEDIRPVNPSAKVGSPSSSKYGSPMRHRKRCLSNLCIPGNIPSQDRGISAATYAAAKLAERKHAHLSISSGPSSPDTLIITSVSSPTRPPTDEFRSESSGVQAQDKEFPSLAEATLSFPARKNRLFMTLGRMQAREAKVLDLASLHAHSYQDPASFQKAQGEPRLIKGKLKRISNPVLLQGEDERVALWGMISNGKLAPHSHK